jgi:hypothetical protein
VLDQLCIWKRDVPVSEMTFYPVEHPEQQMLKNVPLDGETILAKRSIRFWPANDELLGPHSSQQVRRFVTDRPGTRRHCLFN